MTPIQLRRLSAGQHTSEAVRERHYRRLRARSERGGDGPLPVAGLLAISAAMFVSMTSEFLPGGLIPHIAEDLDRTLSGGGQLVTIFAFTVVLTTAPLASLTRRVKPKPVLILGLAGIALGNAAAALAPNFEWLVGARVAGGMAHGLFWAVAIAYASYLVRPEQLGRAMAITAAGGSAAGILGVPIGNAFGQAFGWRVAFALMAAVGLVIVGVLVRWLPAADTPTRPDTSVRRRTAGSHDPSWIAIAVVCGLILIVVVSQTSFGTYMAPWLVDIVGLPAHQVPVYLLMTGVVGAAGVLLAGRLQDRFPRMTLPAAGVLAVAALAMFPLPAIADAPLATAATAVVLSLAFAGIPMMLQTRLMSSAPAHLRRAAGAAQTITFNVAIGTGALVGGFIIDTSGLRLLPWAAAGGMVLAVFLSTVFDLRRRRVVVRTTQTGVADPPPTVHRR